MINTNATNFRKNLYSVLDQTLEYNEPVNINTKKGNLVLMSENDYNNMVETLYLLNIPGMKEKLLEGKNTSVDDCVPLSEVDW